MVVRNWLTSGGLDRVDEHRSRAEWIAHQWVREDALVLVMDAHGAVATDDDGTALRMVRPFADFDAQEHFLLGTVDDSPIFMTVEPHDGPNEALRTVAERLSDTEVEIAMAANALRNWHRIEPCCPGCGNSTHVVRGGYGRVCEECTQVWFPRADPAVIVAVLDGDDRLFLGHHRDWDAGRMSLLAGFVDAGESFEQAVHRELSEEADLSLGRLAYLGSQPWPFPRSLMVAYAAEAVSSDFSCDDREIVEAGWYSRDQVREAVASGAIKLPGGVSIAHHVIQSWLGGSLSARSLFGE